MGINGLYHYVQSITWIVIEPVKKVYGGLHRVLILLNGLLNTYNEWHILDSQDEDNFISDKYQAINSDNADYFEQEDE